MREQFHNLQSLRGLACLLVVLYHLSRSEAGFGLGFNPLRIFQWCGYAGVDLFFVLSGFIIATATQRDLGHPSRLPRYLFRRAWRIYPTFWAALAVAALHHQLTSDTPLLRPGWVSELGDTILLLPQPALPRLLAVAWTLSYELMFYAAFALLFILPRRAAIPALALWGGLVVRAAMLGEVSSNRFAFLALDPFVLEFLAGAVVAAFPIRLSGRSACAVIAAGLAWCSACSARFNQAHNPDYLALEHLSRVATFGVPAALLVLALAAWERTGGRMRPRWLEPVGDASYSIYLLHVPFMLVFLAISLYLNWDHKKLAHGCWLVYMMAGCVVPGLLFYRYVERPILNLVKTRRAPPESVPMAPAPVRKAA
jgi:exopolysaccharide production protein ExoZ